MRRSVGAWLAATLLGACVSEPRPAAIAPRCPSAVTSASASASTPPGVLAAGAPDPTDCDPSWPADAAPVSVTWSRCAQAGAWFATRGFPAISKDGERVAIAVHQDLAGRTSANLRISVRRVDGDLEVDSVPVLAPGELDEPQPPEARARTLVSPRIERANAKLAGLVPMAEHDKCAAPLPWPSDVYGDFEGCEASALPSQTVVCGARKGAPTQHVLTLSLRAPLLTPTRKPPALPE
jgi:hypothetical protein